MVFKLTNEDGGQQSSRQTEENDENISNRQVDNEIIGDGPHTWSPEDNSHNEAITDNPHNEYGQVSQAIKYRHSWWMSVKEIGLTCLVAIVTLIGARSFPWQLIPIICL